MSDYNNDDIKDTEDEQKYEDVCYMCRRPESKTGRMLHIPGMNNMCICIDCMERSFRVMDGSNYADLMQGMNIQDIFPGGLNMDDMMNIQNQIPKKQKLKKKAKDCEEAHPEFDIKNIPAPHILKASWMNLLSDRIRRRKRSQLPFIITTNVWQQIQWMILRLRSPIF